MYELKGIMNGQIPADKHGVIHMRSRKTSRRPRNIEDNGNGIEETRVFSASEVRKPRKGWVKTAALVLAAVVLFLGGAAFGFYRHLATTPAPELIPPEYLETYEGRINILAMGIDTGVNGKLVNPQADRTGTRSDVMILISFDPEIKEVGLINIPRDTRVYISEQVFAYEKIAHAHAYGGPSLAVKTVEDFLNVPIHYYVRVDFEAFKKAVNVLNGIDFDVPQDMKYDDPAQNLYIDLKKGPQTLDGDKALQLVRFREYVDGDISRIAIQQQFLKAVVKKLASMASVLKLPELVQTLSPYIKTDLSPDDILNLAYMAAGVSVDNVKMATLPGSDKWIDDGQGELSYWVADREATDKTVDELARGISKERNATIAVAIQNGNGVAGAADKLATILRDKGFNVVSVGNSNKQDYEETRIIAPSDKRSSQYLVSNSIRDDCPDAKSVVDGVPNGVDVLIIVGKDFNT